MHQSSGDLRAFPDGDLAIEQRHKHISHLGLKDIVEKFQRVVMHGCVRRLQTNVGTF